ncbi:MAG TPA: chromosome segregation protein SMC [Planctomycetota bacterium]|jgi:chromosome segregation protein
MHLKRLEAFGFKSFADKVVFDFEPGVTGFVGPNGCGKSNVVDAVKWVLGEQSAKSLRGGEMLDVIFNGTSNRKPLNFAEVTLTFDNADGTLPLGAPEVAVSRRLFRSGESEYLINKAICRLRDIRELFWDTGIGTSTYSIIEQGRISALLEANSKDRRSLFEEAAGIHKYKERKKIALRKLERVEQNLARLNDLLGEVERNLKTVTRQAEKARKAREISEKLRQVKLDILLFDTFTSEAALREITAGMAAAAERAAALTDELAKVQATTASEQERMATADTRLGEAQRELSEAQTKIERLNAEAEAERRNIDDLGVESARAREASTAAGDRAAVIASERERVELDGARAQENLDQHTAQATALASEVATQQDAREEQARTLEAARREALDAMGRRSQLQDALSRGEAELSTLEYRVRKSHAQMTKAEDQLRFAQAESEELRGRMRDVLHRRELLETEQSGLRALQSRTDEELERLNRMTQDLQRDLEGRRSRLTALEGLRESGEGLSPGARAVLTNLRMEAAFSGEVQGLVADCLGVDPRLEQAIEAALGGHLETIVVASSQAAQALASRLAEQELGRATFLPLDRAEAVVFAGAFSNRLDRSALTAPGCLGCAAELVSCDEKYSGVAKALLGDVLVFDTVANATQAFEADKGSSGWHRVTLGGTFLETSGCLTGGRYQAQRLGLIGRKNEISRLHVQMDELNLRIEALSERTGFLEKRAQRLARDEERLRLDLIALGHTNTELRSMLAAIEREESRSEEEKNLAVREIHELEAERAAHAERVLKMRTDLEACKREETDASVAVQTHEATLTQMDAALSERRQQLAGLERDVATLRERVKALEREAQSLSAQFAERRDESEREKARAESLDERRATAIAALAEKDKNRAELQDLLELYAMQVESLTGQKEEARQAFEAARGREREVATELEGARQELSAVREKEVNLRVRLENKLEQARSEFQIDALSELATRGGPPPLPKPALPKRGRARQADAQFADGVDGETGGRGDGEISDADDQNRDREGAAETEGDLVVAEATGVPESENAAPCLAASIEDTTHHSPLTTDQSDMLIALELARTLEEKLARLGPVNMYALEQQQELEERHKFLKTQFEDLESARVSLKDVISRINRRSRTLFQETFEAVKAQFNEVFRKLFGGGKADLALEAGEDVLEAGIEIIARPPGKEPRNVSLLSGGEKTMTMIALLFAVFRSRPAPFCILDEVDAPLDEANVDRFNMIVQDYLDRSQFVIITHNRATMSYANVLYGITMPEPGVSKRIALKFSEIEKHLPMDEINRAAEKAREEALSQAEAPKADGEAPAPDAAPAEAEPQPAEVENSTVVEEQVAGE